MGRKLAVFLNLDRRSGRGTGCSQDWHRKHGQIPVVEPVSRVHHQNHPENIFRYAPVGEPAVAETVSVVEPVQPKLEPETQIDFGRGTGQPSSQPKLPDRKNGLTKTVISFASGLRF